MKRFIILGVMLTALLSSCVKESYVAVKYISLNTERMTLINGTSETIIAEISPLDATNKKIFWSTSNSSVAKVNDGIVIAIGEGECLVTAKSDDDGAISSICQVTVVKDYIPVKGIELNEKSLELEMGKTATLVATVSPADASHKEVIWTSSDENIITVDAKGKLTAVAPGKATVAVSASDGGFTASCIVVVTAPINGISLDKTEVILYENEDETINVSVQTEDASKKVVEWSSSDENVARVCVGMMGNDKIIAVKSGVATITAKTVDGRTANCLVTVRCHVEELRLKEKEITLEEGSSYYLEAEVKPERASDKSLSWESSDPEIASVDNDGKVIAHKFVKDRNVSISVTSKDGEKKDVCVVYVNRTLNNICILLNGEKKTSISMKKNETLTLKAGFEPSEVSKEKVKWITSNPEIVTVDEDGTLKAIAGGKSTITVVSEDELKTASCAIDVTVPLKGISAEGQTTVVMQEKESKGLKLEFNPEDATNKKIIWTSEDEASVKVTDGIATALKAKGENVVITAVSEEGSFKAVWTIKVECKVTGLRLNQSELSLKEGDTFQMESFVMPENATNKKVTWSSNYADIVSVDNNGLVTAHKTSDTQVTVSAMTGDGSFSASCIVSVNDDFGKVKSIKIKSNGREVNTLEMFVKDSQALDVEVLPEDAPNKGYNWSISDESVVSIDPSGTLTAKAVGTAVVCATSVDGGKHAQCIVTVKNQGIAVTSISLSRASLTLSAGESHTLKATILPENATNKTIEWESNNPGVAIVDNNGKVTGLDGGSCVITATTVDGGFTATCVITVTKISPSDVSNVRLNFKSKTIDIDDYFTLEATVEPSTASNKNVTWRVSNSDLLKLTLNPINQYKVTIGGKGAGKAYVVVKTDVGDKKDTCYVIVNPKAIHVSSVSLNKTEYALEIGKGLQLEATVLPDNADNKKIFWVSSNEKVATVDGSGYVLAKSTGEANISVVTEDGGLSAKCSIEVVEQLVHATGISINPSRLTLKVGESYDLNVTVEPDNATNKNVTWTLPPAASDIVSINNGRVTALKAGISNVAAHTVPLYDGGEKFTAYCMITVENVVAEKIVIDKSAVNLKIGESTRLTVIFYPSNTTDKTIEWISDTPSVVSVDSNGNIKAKCEGSAVIEAIAKETKKVAKCYVTVRSTQTEGSNEGVGFDDLN